MSDTLDVAIALRAQQLQNEYAYAIDTRDWALFRTLFSDDVQAVYPKETYDGLDAWVASFVPTHDAFGWTRHEMTNHVAGSDNDRMWAACYGFIEWVTKAEPGRMNVTHAIYRDRLRRERGRWIIWRRELTLLSERRGMPIPDGMVLTHALHQLG